MGTSTASNEDRSWLGLADDTRPSRGLVSGLAPAAAALAVCAAYYAGSHLGLALRFPPATTSLLWPPNAILTAALLLAPKPRHWWFYLAAAFPAHLVMLLPTGWPLPFIVALFVTNCSEAVLAAGSVRWLGGFPVRFDTLRRMALFIATVALMAPFVSSFADAALVTLWRGEPFWEVWRTRFVSNTLTELMLVPACVVAVREALPMARRVSWRRGVEASLLVLFTLVLVLIVAGDALRGGLWSGAGFSASPLALMLAPLLWAAVRFGPASTSFSLLSVTALLLWVETQGGAAFRSVPPEGGILPFQSALGVVAVPLLCLAALMQEHRKAEEVLHGQLHFERLLSRLSTAFVPVASHEMEATFESWVARIGQSFHVDRFMVLLLHGDDVEVAYSWAAPGVPPLPAGLVARGGGEAPELLRSQLLDIARLRAPAGGPLPAPPERGGRSLTVPLSAGRTFGVVSMEHYSGDRDWPEELVQRLRLVADVLAGALARKDTEEALRRSEAMKSAILASLPTSVAVLDRGGRIVAVNEEWSRVAAQAEGEPRASDAPWDLLGATKDGGRVSGELAHGVDAILNGSKAVFAQDFVSRRGEVERWIHMSAVPLRFGHDGGAVVSYSDVTERKRAEIEADQSRQELAHFLRVSTVGVMTTSLAHELNQPLTAILANAQAAQRLLAVDPPDIEEFRNVLADMIEEDKRAGEIISRLRDMLRKSKPRRSVLDVNALVGEVAKLVSSDALIRKVDLHLELDPETPPLTGDRVQLQQVVLNLLRNALEAAPPSLGEGGAVVLRTGRTEAGGVEVSVRDTGDGLPAELLDRAFEPFFTTKLGGMGMGLSIARSIVTAHGGTISAANAPGGGAVFRMWFPPPPRPETRPGAPWAG